MKRYLFAALFSLALVGGKAEALNLTPLRIMIGGDGPERVRYYFRDAEKRFVFRMDPKMNVTGSSDSAAFRFEDVATAATRFFKSPSPTSVAFDENGLRAYEALARSSLPSDALNVQLVEQIPDAIAINGWKGVQFIYTYQFYGLSYRRSITFLNFSETEQFVFDVSSRAVDYPAVYARSYRFLNSLYEMPNDQPVGPS